MIAETKSESTKEITIQHDGTFDIATGRSRKETNWKNKQWLWSDLVRKLSQTHRTAETLSEYMAAKKPRQDEIKDIGGFVGGYLSGGRRKANNVLHRQLITLDIDQGNGDVWDDFTLLYDNAACIYSTHKHSPEAPRLRLVLPMDREVSADEYEAVSRRIAGHLGIDNFDHTTFEPSRLMYWPSTAKDAHFYFDYQDGPWLSTDEILSSYHDWQDSSEWPTSSKLDKLVQRAIKKQGDPLEKPGLIGAFCRAYDIHQAIEAFLPDVYEACAVENRYTFTAGSTAAGLIVYDDKYAFSHHGTDPVSGKLCNAFDLVRIHKYGLKDEDVKEETPVTKLPSHIEMIGFVQADERTRLAIAKADFDSDEESAEVEGNTWRAEMDIDSKGRYLSTEKNFELIINNDPTLKGAFRYDSFLRRYLVVKDLPWQQLDDQESKTFTDRDLIEVTKTIAAKYHGLNNSKKIMNEVISTCYWNQFNSLQDFIKSLPSWDHQERAETLLIDYMGAEDTEWVRLATRKSLIAAVARAMRPGCKVDTVLTLIGKQGTFKSTLISKLAGNRFSDSFNFHLLKNEKSAEERLQGFWIIEISEMTGLRKAEAEAVKGFLSRQVDRYRVPYERTISEFERQCIFFGSSNDYEFLRGDENRRFWPVDVRVKEPRFDVNSDLTEDVVQQIWAEAYHYFTKGHPWVLTTEAERKLHEQQVQEHTESDPRVGMISKFLDTPVPEDWEERTILERKTFFAGDPLEPAGVMLRNRICIAEIWCELFGEWQRNLTPLQARELSATMRRVKGWRESTQKRLKFYGPQKVFVRDGVAAGNAKYSVIDTEKHQLH